MIASDGSGYSVNLWDVESLEMIGSFLKGHTGRVHGVVFWPG